MSWWARVGQLYITLVRRAHKYILCKSDMTIFVIAIYKKYVSLFNTKYNHIILIHHLLSFSSSHIHLPILLLISGDIHPNPGPVNKNFSLCHLNARSLKAAGRVNEINETLVEDCKFDLIAVTESHLAPSTKDHEVELPSFKIFRKDRNRNGGGVAIYCHQNFSPHRRIDLERDDLEIIWVEVNISNKKHLISSCYRPPGQNRLTATNFINLLRSSLEQALQSNPTSLTLLGDLNDRCTIWDSIHSDSELKNDLHTLLIDLNLFQLITTPTRGNNILDLLITNSPIHFYDHGTLPPLTNLDHDIIFGKLQYSYSTSSPYSRRIWKYDHGDYTSMNNQLNNINITPNCDPNQTACSLTHEISECMKTHIPSNLVTIKPRDKPWYTSAVKKLHKQVRKLHALKTSTNNPIHIQQFKTKRHEAKEALRTAKNNYYQSISNNILDPECTPKSFWKLVKGVYNPNNHSSIPTLIDNGTQYTDDADKAELLNNHFVSQTILPDSNIPLPPMHYLTLARLDRIAVTPLMVKKILLSLNVNKAVGPDHVGNRILKECAESLCHPLAILFQSSLDMGVFPTCWKDAQVSSIFKQIDRQIKTNYRPISLLSCMSKVLEKIVFDHVYPFFVENKLLTDDNSGFRPNDSAINRLLSIIENIHKGFDDHMDSVFVSLDISKAFDRVWHEGLIHKLEQNGISGSLLAWFSSYLSNRCQQVVISSRISSFKPIHSEVP